MNHHREKTDGTEQETVRRTLRIGVTGGIGSGKSVVCAMFRDLGIRVFEADCVAKQLMESDAALRTLIISTFGASSYRSDGTLDRAALAQTVFNNRHRRQELEAIVHPRVRKEMDAFFASGRSTEYAIVEAALVFENGVDRELDYTVVIDADLKTRIRRAMQRSGGTQEEIQKRIDAQMPADEKRERADFTIVNNGTLDELRSRVRFIHTLLSGIASRT